MIDQISRADVMPCPPEAGSGERLLAAYEEEINRLTATLIRQEAELVETRVELNKRVRSLQFFQNLNKRILAAKTHREIYQVVVRSLVEIGFDKALIFKRRQNEYRVVAHHGYASDALRQRLPAPRLLQLIEEKGALLVNGENRAAIDCSYEKDLEVSFFIATSFTLRQGGEQPHILLAGNSVETTVRRSRLTEVDLEILRTLSRQIGVAVENAFFYEQLEKSEKKFRSLYEMSVEGLFQTSIDGRILSANPAMARMLGYDTPGELIEAGDPGDVQPMLKIENFARFARILTAKGSVIGYEVELLGKGNERIWGSIAARCVRSNDGEPSCFEGSIVDITDQKRARQLEIEKIAAEKANRTKGQFLANMSHEIRTPMNGVLGMTTLLMDTRLNAIQQHYVQAIRQSSEALLTVINDILDFSKIEAGKISLEIVRFNLRGLLDDVVDLIETRMDPTRVRFTCYAEPEVPQWVKGDPRRLRQVLINLAMNAIKFTSRGDIRIRVSPAGHRDGCQLRFSVRDTGPGVPPEQQQTLFESFTQLDNSLTREVEGTGLGLAISRQLVELMGGKIGVISAPGSGSDFWFTVGVEVCQDGLPREQETADFCGTRLLVAEPDDEYRSYLCRQLRAWGAVVDEVSDDADFRRKIMAATADNLPYRLIISDGSLADAALQPAVEDMDCRRVILHHNGELTRMSQPPGSDVVYLTRPIRYAGLLRTCSCLLAGGDAQRCVVGITPQLWAYDSGRARARVLVVEDHNINQQVVVGMLSRLGCVHIDAVANGLEAIQNIRRFPYDIVFMDVSMPVMDGLEATRRIRSLLHDAGARRLPIIALTAHAMVGDRERCLEAGMDEVVTKPVQPQALAAALDAWLPSGSPERTEYSGDSGIRLQQRPASAHAGSTVIFDLQQLSDRLLGDEHHARMIAEYFQNEVGGQIEAIAAAVDRGDLAESGRLVHRLKGSSGNVQAGVLHKLMSAMQDAAAAGDLEALTALTREVRGHCPVLIRTIAEQLEN